MVALTIAGSDPSGGAGIQADLKTFHQFGVYGQAVITLITVQNTLGVLRVECLPAELVEAQIRAVMEDIRPVAVKTGALGHTGIIEAVARLDFDLVVDPVMISKHGVWLLNEEARSALRDQLIPRSYLLTPNLHEASALTGKPVETTFDMREAARRLVDMGAKSALIKGGHLSGAPTDILLHRGEWYEFPGQRIATQHTHGTGCTYSAAITACLAKGYELPEAVQTSKAFIQEAIRTNPGLGHGTGPVNHHAALAGRTRASCARSEPWESTSSRRSDPS
ncbi:MAG: bifunctional hydroxymethylpyrimidine kinase/phosphomethylpyrimidine kinase [Bryobacteraceae bacterium]